jgi:hypothetical protein
MTTLDALQIVWPTRSRTGSQFLLQLTRVTRNGGLGPQSRISGSRREGLKPDDKIGNFHAMFNAGRGVEYLADNRIRSLKYEDPGKDDFALELLDRAPNAVFVTSYRPIERVLESHFNITSWGHNEADVLHQFSACATLYEALASAGRLFMVNVDDPSTFNAEAFRRFLGMAELTENAAALVRAWEPVNDLRYQVERNGGEFTGRVAPPRLDRLRDIHPWVGDVERRYEELIRRSNEL